MLSDICEDKRVFGLGHCAVILTRDPVGGPTGCSADRKGMGWGQEDFQYIKEGGVGVE